MPPLLPLRRQQQADHERFFAPIPQGPLSPSFVKPSCVGKSRPPLSSSSSSSAGGEGSSSSLLLTTAATSKGLQLRPPGSPPPPSLTTSSSRSRSLRRIALGSTLAALLLVFIVFSFPLNLALPRRLGSLGTHLHRLGHSASGSLSQVGRSGASGRRSTLDETTVVEHAPGWTALTNLYQLNTTFYLVSSLPSTAFPAIRAITSTGVPVGNAEAEIRAREPTELDMQVITPEQAAALFFPASSAAADAAAEDDELAPLHLAGTSWIVNDPAQLIAHFYHFAAELVFGLWRTTVALLPPGLENARGELAKGEGSRGVEPMRLVWPHVAEDAWHDYSGMNALLMRAVLPQTTVLSSSSFAALSVPSAAASASEGRFRPVVYERAVFADRAAAMRGERFADTGRTAAEAFSLPSTPYWWAPVRRRMLDFVRREGLEAGETTTAEKAAVDVVVKTKTQPVVTYISRQNWNRRKLLPSAHAALLAALKRAAEEDGWELVVADMETLALDEQVALAGRCDVLMGVHGNGLTHLLWMDPTPKSTVLEFFTPGGWAADYEFTARALGIGHYGFWDDRVMTSPDTPPTAYPDGFQGDAIPIDAEAVVRVVRMRLNSDEEADDG